MGTFDKLAEYLGDAPKGMRRAEFEKWLGMSLVEAGAGQTHILTSKFEGEDRPVGLVLGRGARHIMDTAVWWFPWATSRNKLECAVKFLNTMRVTCVVFIAAEESDWRFYDYLLRYGMMHRIGKMHDCFEAGKLAKLYQTRGFAGVV